jgi:anti-sigma B factor antagonist
MKLDNKSSGDVMIVLPTGRLDAPSSEELKADMERLIGEGWRKIVANLEGVDYISSSGLRVMLSALKKLRSLGGDLKLASLRPYVRETFEIASEAPQLL